MSGYHSFELAYLAQTYTNLLITGKPLFLHFKPMPGGFKDNLLRVSPEGYYEVKTWWNTMDDFVAWTNSPSFAEAHKDRPPKEMFAGANELTVHEVFLSTDEAATTSAD